MNNRPVENVTDWLEKAATKECNASLSRCVFDKMEKRERFFYKVENSSTDGQLIHHYFQINERPTQQL